MYANIQYLLSTFMGSWYWLMNHWLSYVLAEVMAKVLHFRRRKWIYIPVAVGLLATFSIVQYWALFYFWKGIQIGYTVGPMEGWHYLWISTLALKFLSWFIVWGVILVRGVGLILALTADLTVGLNVDIIRKFAVAAQNGSKFAHQLLLQLAGLAGAGFLRIDEDTLEMLLSGEFMSYDFSKFDLESDSLNQAVERLNKLAEQVNEVVLYMMSAVKAIVGIALVAHLFNTVKNGPIDPRLHPVFANLDQPRIALICALFLGGLALVAIIFDVRTVKARSTS